MAKSTQGSRKITRAEWSKRFRFCFGCGKSTFHWPNQLETHEIANGPARAKALKEPATWLRLCHHCHQGPEGVHNIKVWPIARQLAAKKKYDPEHYDRLKVNMLRGRQPEAITEAEVDEYLEEA